ncbi:putative 2-oxoglutarate-dependent dioxygenase AOP1.2 isoform X2 [Nicotiana tabacum]|uniref:2-oxoglutarate-dependent dioxygenase AOP1.2 isoform X2 n=1 Tax=Nicotiana tabacum TaxID=4097 RepID=A0AC58TZ25_TOBAC
MASKNMSNIPSIYLAEENLKPATSSWIAACQEVRQAFESYGCFVAIYDKISKELSNSIFQILPELFDLPSKIKSQNISDIPYFGYLPPNRSRPLYESMGIEDATNLQVVQGFTNLMWPSGNQHFCETFHFYGKKLAEFYEILCRMVFESYGVNKCYDFYAESNTLFLHRVNKYRVPRLDESTVGVSDHTDLDFITILHQNHVDGLEVKTKDGNWISVQFPPSSFVIMAGEGLRDGFHLVLFGMINDLLNSVVRVLLSYGGSHWFKSNSRHGAMEEYIQLCIESY